MTERSSLFANISSRGANRKSRQTFRSRKNADFYQTDKPTPVAIPTPTDQASEKRTTIVLGTEADRNVGKNIYREEEFCKI